MSELLSHSGSVTMAATPPLEFFGVIFFLRESFYVGDHVTHLENVSEEEMNRLLGIVLDVEYLYTCVHKEEDADTKQVYFSLFKVSLTLSHIVYITTLSLSDQFLLLFLFCNSY